MMRASLTALALLVVSGCAAPAVKNPASCPPGHIKNGKCLTHCPPGHQKNGKCWVPN